MSSSCISTGTPTRSGAMSVGGSFRNESIEDSFGCNCDRIAVAEKGRRDVVNRRRVSK